MERGAFFAALRQSLMKGGLKQSQVETIEIILDEAGRRATKLGHLAYILATAYHEPGPDMVPNVENLTYTSAERIRAVWPTRFPTLASAAPFVRNPRALANKVYNGRLGNREGSDDGWTYRGRGLVHPTGLTSYERAGRAAGIDLVAEPDRAAEPAIAVFILFEGMLGGWFTGLSLADVDDTPGYEDDRRVVNGTDRAALIAGYARAFEAALRAGGWSGQGAPGPHPDISETEAAALRALSAWWAAKPSGAAEWLAAMPKEAL